RFTGQSHMSRVVKVVVPLGGVTDHHTAISCMKMGNIAVVFGDEMPGPVGKFRPHRLCEFYQKVRLRRVLDLVDRVEPQTIEIELVEPVEGVVEEKLADRQAVIGNRSTPRRFPVLREEGGCENWQVV